MEKKVNFDEEYYKKGWSHGYDQAIEAVSFISISYEDESHVDEKIKEILNRAKEMKSQLDNFQS